MKMSFPIERFTLPNGLRVVVSPDRSSPTAAVVVVYDVGFRSEPEGRTGFAHLFEHLMFEGSANLPKMEHSRLVESNGGADNGQTTRDFTRYWEVLPSNAVEIGLFLEADRMGSVALTEETLRNQIDVVKEEIRVNVHNRAYGGFPWMYLPDILFTTYPNAHDGYGSFRDLEAATLDDAREFYDRYYAPANAVLTIAGDVDPDDVHRMAERQFDRVPARDAPGPRDYSEPPPSSERRGDRTDPNAPLPALALGYRVPDPIDQPDEYAAAVVLAALLGDGDAARLHRRLVKEERIASHVGSGVSEFGDWLGTRDPTFLEIIAYYFDATSTDRVIGLVDDEVARIAAGLDEAELERVVASMTSDYFGEQDRIISRTLNIAELELLRGRAEVFNEIPEMLRGVTSGGVAKAAGVWLDPSKRAVLEWKPGKS